MYQLISYIKFLFHATNQHGVHSPFIYDFVTKCLYDKGKYKAYEKLKVYRNNLKHSNKTLQVNDLGEGSKVLHATKRSVKKMINTSSSSKKESQLIYKTARYFNSKAILELGTSLGMGAYALALSNNESKVTTIEGCPNTSNFTKKQFKTLNIHNTTFLTGDFTTIIPRLKDESFDVIFFDGHHNKAATIQYFESLLTKAKNETVFIFDDMYWSKGMTEAWHYIKNHIAVTVTVDCFHLGFVFFRKEQAKEHFKIRV